MAAGILATGRFNKILNNPFKLTHITIKRRVNIKLSTVI